MILSLYFCCELNIDAKVFFQGNLDNDFQLMARCHVALDSRNVTKIMTQVFSIVYSIDL